MLERQRLGELQVILGRLETEMVGLFQVVSSDGLSLSAVLFSVLVQNVVGDCKRNDTISQMCLMKQKRRKAPGV